MTLREKLKELGITKDSEFRFSVKTEDVLILAHLFKDFTKGEERYLDMECIDYDKETNTFILDDELTHKSPEDLKKISIAKLQIAKAYIDAVDSDIMVRYNIDNTLMNIHNAIIDCIDLINVEV